MLPSFWLNLQPIARIEFFNDGGNMQTVSVGQVPRARVKSLMMSPTKWNAGEITRLLPGAVRAGVARVNPPRFQARNAGYGLDKAAVKGIAYGLLRDVQAAGPDLLGLSHTWACFPIRFTRRLLPGHRSPYGGA